MRTHWKRSWIGYKKSSVLLQLSRLDVRFKTSKKELVSQLQRLQSELDEMKKQSDAPLAEKHQIAGFNTASAAVSPDGIGDEDRKVYQPHGLHTVLFGLNMRSVDKYIKQSIRLQNEELRNIQAQLNAVAQEHALWSESCAVSDEAPAEAPIAPPTPDAAALTSAEAEHELSAPANEASAAWVEEAAAVEEGVSSEVEAKQAMQDVWVDEPAQAEQPDSNVKFGRVVAFPIRMEGKSDAAVEGDKENVEENRTGSLNPPKPSTKPKVVGMGFWEDADDYLEKILQESESQSSAALEPSAASAAAELPRHKRPARSAADANGSPASAAEGSSGVKINETPPVQEPRPDDASADLREDGHAAGSAAVSKEIRQLRTRYIVGKIAGENLYDRSGRMIVAKGEAITDAVLDTADREGKLAELIVNMIIPGLGE